MIETLVEKLVDRIIQLIKHREEVDRSLFHDFVEPLWQDFERVHEAYLESFQEYRAMLKAPSVDLSAVIEKIRQDILIYQSLRDRVSAATSHWPASHRESEVRPFLSAVITYLNDPADFEFGTPRPPGRPIFVSTLNISRFCVVDLVENLRCAKIESKEEAIEAIDLRLSMHQIGYRCVSQEYFRLKSSLNT